MALTGGLTLGGITGTYIFLQGDDDAASEAITGAENIVRTGSEASVSKPAVTHAPARDGIFEDATQFLGANRVRDKLKEKLTVSDMDIMLAQKLSERDGTGIDPLRNYGKDYIKIGLDSHQYTLRRHGRGSELALAQTLSNTGMQLAEVQEGVVSRGYALVKGTGPDTRILGVMPYFGSGTGKVNSKLNREYFPDAPVLASRTQSYTDRIVKKSKSVAAEFNGMKGSMPGVMRVGRGGKYAVESFEEFATAALTALSTATLRDKTGAKLVGDSLIRERNSYIQKFFDFSARAVNLSSDLTGEIGAREYGAVLDFTESRALGDSGLFDVLAESGLLSKVYDPRKGATPEELAMLNSTTQGQVFGPLPFDPSRVGSYKMPDVQRTSDLLEFTGEAARLAKSDPSTGRPALHLGGTNVSQSAKGIFMVDAGENNVTGDILNAASRKTDEMYQMAVTEVVSGDFRKPNVVHTSGQFLQGTRNMTLAAVADLAATSASLGHEKLGQFGMTTLAFGVLSAKEANPETLKRVSREFFGGNTDRMQKANLRIQQLLDQGTVLVDNVPGARRVLAARVHTKIPIMAPLSGTGDVTIYPSFASTLGLEDPESPVAPTWNRNRKKFGKGKQAGKGNRKKFGKGNRKKFEKGKQAGKGRLPEHLSLIHI